MYVFDHVAGDGSAMLPQDTQELTRRSYAWMARLGLLAGLLLVVGCKGTAITGAAGNQVDHMGGSRGSMDRDSNGGGGY